jgi:hypothetical protein
MQNTQPQYIVIGRQNVFYKQAHLLYYVLFSVILINDFLLCNLPGNIVLRIFSSTYYR